MDESKRRLKALFILIAIGVLNMIVFSYLKNEAPIVRAKVHLWRRDGNVDFGLNGKAERDGIAAPDDLARCDDATTSGRPQGTKNIRRTEKEGVSSDEKDKKKQEAEPSPPTKTDKQITPNKKQPPLDATEKPPKNTTKVYVTGNVYGFRRTGNRLFVFAAIMAVAWRYSMTPVLSPDFDLQKYFNIDIELDERGHDYFAKWTSVKGCDNLNLEEERLSNKNISLNGYFQTWTCFRDYEKELRKVLAFNEGVIDMAREEFKRIVPNVTFGSDPVKAKVAGGTLVTLHVRRGDMISERNLEQGYTFPGRSFFENSIQFFADADPNLHVVVCCVDIEWCRSNLTDLPATFYFSESKNAIVDLAIMSMGEHAIMTTGTFGWWGAWLANGETVYYSNWPRHGSRLERGRIREEFFMPHWVGMT
ncbi:hypothetical protein CAPTEDRAFT_197105 [Capitella teleta]|uniref:L-Fucosyltransferase n=1 Tax=Capitella teleta TaxID=283909 RepID=R7UMF7_CAPTE|nr:hypothetical protein CAPTEDRAFT_197105 [Capitella teleta]|eukprot:ELU04422.1 hypothetical protein CAPTEDRAFT_197105 [Capitella teleta]